MALMVAHPTHTTIIMAIRIATRIMMMVTNDTAVVATLIMTMTEMAMVAAAMAWEGIKKLKT